MIEREVPVTTRHGLMPTFVACPSEPGAFPGIILYMDAPGIREELRNLARRIARHGYFCLLPDMYYRLGMIRFDVTRRNEATTAAIRAVVDHVSNAFVVDDTAALLAFLDSQDKARPGPVGCVGFCIGGRDITTAASYFPHRIQAAASLYGVRLVTDRPDSPHLILDRIKADLYYGFAETDPGVPPHVIPDFEAALRLANAKYELQVLAGTHHGFNFAERGAYHPEASEYTWDKIFALWKLRLS